MNIKELATKLSAANPDVAQKSIEKLLRAAFIAVRDELSAATEGDVKCLPLGSFKVNSKPAKAKEGKPAPAAGDSVVRISLRLAKGQADKPAKTDAQKEQKKEARKAERKAAKAKGAAKA